MLLNGSFLFLKAASGAVTVSPYIWGGFLLFIGILLVVDLKLVMQEPHKVSTKEAAIYSAVWISIGVLFTGVIWIWQDSVAASEYITGYLIEKSLSMDNVFLWAVLFGYFKVPEEYQYKVLFWGIFGALVMRAGFIFGGIALLNSIDWIIYVFGAILLFTAYRIFVSDNSGIEPENNKIIKWINKQLPQTEKYEEDNFFVIRNGKKMVTPLFTVIIIIELTDVIFAIDSIPAILSITRNEFIVFSSNAFAILGLRALYFLLADMKDRFTYLNEGLAVILGFVGIKFLISEWVKIPIWTSLAFIVVVLTLAIFLSLKDDKKE